MIMKNEIENGSNVSKANETVVIKKRKPRIGFLGVGWIGRNRLQTVKQSGIAEIMAIADPDEQSRARAKEVAPHAQEYSSLEELCSLPLDGIVIATPSALHAEQVMYALKRKYPVFCQKPLARNAVETEQIIDSARRENRLLDVDYSYRYLDGVERINELLDRNVLGDIFSINLVFHNAYGPDKAWFYDTALSGGGCLIDLGIHLVDLVLWMFDFPQVTNITSKVFSKGKMLHNRQRCVEDYAVAHFELYNSIAVSLACSWKLSAGRDAIIEASFYGTHGGASLSNVNGSFYDFTAVHYNGTKQSVLSSPPDDWGGRALSQWIGKIAQGAINFDPSAYTQVTVSRIIDTMYNP